ncbi:transposable element Tcb1 transposase [Trichonephila clavipes]|nr:transposable element Tcb1 transposase [Trichonephila clavipes]
MDYTIRSVATAVLAISMVRGAQATGAPSYVRKNVFIKYPSSSEKDRGLLRYCGLSFRKISSRVGRNQTSVIRICDFWMQEGTTDPRGRSHPPQCTTLREDR